jgi:hypothetical protein
MSVSTFAVAVHRFNFARFTLIDSRFGVSRLDLDILRGVYLLAVLVV